jgi:hypothetical protein
MTGLLANNDLQRIWKEAVVDKVHVPFLNLEALGKATRAESG